MLTATTEPIQLPWIEREAGEIVDRGRRGERPDRDYGRARALEGGDIPQLL
jgi:hypothetical protein